LIGQILVTLTTNGSVKEEDMIVPAGSSQTDGLASGHRAGGRTIALHSLAVLPELQRARVGSTLMKSYIQMVQDAKVADRISLLTYEHLIPWYEKLGFSCLGKSECQYGGKDWYDLVSGSGSREVILID
jgi:ribosomal protein S18 acetylase RimI-like enzyme